MAVLWQQRGEGAEREQWDPLLPTSVIHKVFVKISEWSLYYRSKYTYHLQELFQKCTKATLKYPHRKVPLALFWLCCPEAAALEIT